MLQRDFGVRIYKALISLPEREDKKDKKSKKEERKEKKEEKDDETDDPKPKRRKSGDDKDKKEERDEKKVCSYLICSSSLSGSILKCFSFNFTLFLSKIQLLDLLMAFVYFDQSHCGYLLEKDMEEILYTLGLHLSRAQVKKLLNKVVLRESCFYRRLTDTSKDEENQEESEELQEDMLGGNFFLFLPQTSTVISM
uniref:EF-hand domain-containing protein n=1 Tax=Ficedula albicollis TaxID=59894 RepID=A0A803VJ03_FICAL